MIIGGSSPLARGLQARPPPRRPRRRIIPARAGFTSHAPHRPDRGGDHPRSRGVYLLMSGLLRGCRGSSPLARGLRCLLCRELSAERIIPARAGFTAGGGVEQPGRWDHPRSRGVYLDNEEGEVGFQGSSPLARGLLRAAYAAKAARRIIPARAGFTPRSSASMVTVRDHPRSRGVYSGGGRTPTPAPGSSPLARGLPGAAASRVPAAGIIPARAGFTAEEDQGRRVTWDHPRSRGVYEHYPHADMSEYGSSPLARGLRPPGLTARLMGGIIPARAGFTSIIPARVHSRRDHPRSRGVYRGASGSRRQPWGSSPLARGLLRRRPGALEATGIIPARAGFTRAEGVAGH